jgi:hypothetical protein
MRFARTGLALAAAAALLAAAAAWAEDTPEAGGQATVKVQSQHMFPRPVFYAEPVASLSFGEVLTLGEQQGDWFMATRAGGTSGWVHSTALTGAVSGDGDIGEGSGEVSSDEVMLAGRGFNSQVEEAYSSDHPELDFTRVDAMEAMEVTPSQLEAFLAQGGLIEAQASSAGEQDASGTSSRGRGQ